MGNKGQQEALHSVTGQRYLHGSTDRFTKADGIVLDSRDENQL